MWVKNILRLVGAFITLWHSLKTFSFIFRTLLARIQHEVTMRR